MVDIAYTTEEKQGTHYFKELSRKRFTFQFKCFTHISVKEAAAQTITGSLHHQ